MEVSTVDGKIKAVNTMESRLEIMHVQVFVSIIIIIIVVVVVVVITGSALEQHCADGHISSHWEGRILTHTDYSTESKP